MADIATRVFNFSLSLSPVSGASSQRFPFFFRFFSYYLFDGDVLLISMGKHLRIQHCGWVVQSPAY